MQETNLIKVDTGVSLSYRVWGEAGPPLVLVHGLASTLRIWDFVAPALAKRFRVIAYDQRGHGGSDKPRDGYDLATELADLRGLIRTLGLQKPVVVGHSWGATLALAYAGEYPDDCAGVALVDGGVVDFSGMPGITWERAEVEMAPPDLSQYRLEDLVRRAGSGRLSGLPEPYLYEYFGSMMEVQPDDTIRARLARANHMRILRTIWDTRAEDLMRKVTCPALVVVADMEPTDERQAVFLDAKKRGVARAEELLDRVKVVWLKDTIHDIPLQRPEELSRLILEYFGD